MKYIADHLDAVVKIIATIFSVITIACWYGVTTGSWNNGPNGCIEFDIRPTIEGIVYAPSDVTITKYENGFTLLNWASFRFFTERKKMLSEGGIATGWINPFSGILTLKYKNQTHGGHLVARGYREEDGIPFKWSSKKCHAKNT